MHPEVRGLFLCLQPGLILDGGGGWGASTKVSPPRGNIVFLGDINGGRGVAGKGLGYQPIGGIFP